LPKNRQDN